MTKTHSRMKWLVLALLVVIIAGAVALALSLNARADEPITFRVIISKDATQANNYARAQEWIGTNETCRSNSTLQSSNTDNPVFRFENPQLFNTYGLSTGQKDDARSLRKYLSEHHLGANDFNTEIMIYVLNDVIWVNTHSNSISGLSSRSTLTDADGNFPAKDLTWHFVGVTGYYDQETRPTIYWDMGQEASGSNAAADANAYV
ncbi:MAG: hypothetical protein J6Z79_02215, partial [Clostridia bacterium]|nr:hypothetical protein [Clostridia bacterium]